jgi:hypothetical protein
MKTTASDRLLKNKNTAAPAKTAIGDKIRATQKAHPKLPALAAALSHAQPIAGLEIDTRGFRSDAMWLARKWQKCDGVQNSAHHCTAIRVTSGNGIATRSGRRNLQRR